MVRKGGCDDNVQTEGGKKSKKTTTKKTGAKRPPNAWMKALKDFNKGKKTWTIPKKGTSDYAEVRSLMAKYK